MHNNYFNSLNLFFDNELSMLKARKNRIIFSNLSKILFIKAGDILSVIFRKRSIIYRFEGVCISIKNKKLLNINSSITLRNVLFGIGIEFMFSYFYNRVFFAKTQDYKRKNFWYNRSKLYFLRNRLNRASRVL